MKVKMKMVEKHFCDMCKEETPNDSNIILITKNEVKHEKDLCDKCLNKPLSVILAQIGFKDIRYVKFLIYDDFWKRMVSS